MKYNRRVLSFAAAAEGELDRDPPTRRLRGIAGVLAASLLLPAPTYAAGRFRVVPGVGVATVHDDNLFSSPTAAQAGWIWRLSPSVRADYRSTPLTARATYGFDAERYARHPRLDDAQARRQALLETRYLPRPTWELSFSGAYVTTQNAGELFTAAGIELGRLAARRLTLTPALSHRLDAFTTGTASYTLLRDEIVGRERAVTHVTALTGERRLGVRDTGHLAYWMRRFAFDGLAAGTAHGPLVGWSRRLSSLTRLHLEAGPRFYRGEVGAELSASLHHRFRRGETSLQYARTQATLMGGAGVVEVDALTALLGYAPARALRLSAASGLYRGEGTPGRSWVRRLEMGAAWHVARRLALTASHLVNVQTGVLARAAGGRIPHQVLTVRLVAGEI